MTYIPKRGGNPANTGQFSEDADRRSETSIETDDNSAQRARLTQALYADSDTLDDMAKDGSREYSLEMRETAVYVSQAGSDIKRGTKTVDEVKMDAYRLLYEPGRENTTAEQYAAERIIDVLHRDSDTPVWSEADYEFARDYDPADVCDPDNAHMGGYFALRHTSPSRMGVDAPVYVDWASEQVDGPREESADEAVRWMNDTVAEARRIEREIDGIVGPDQPDTARHYMVGGKFTADDNERINDYHAAMREAADKGLIPCHAPYRDTMAFTQKVDCLTGERKATITADYYGNFTENEKSHLASVSRRVGRAFDRTNDADENFLDVHVNFHPASASSSARRAPNRPPYVPTSST